ncbi:MAG TPA: radical SAM protein [Streptosporangiaceae bacterium]|nr:radical SAM protein [Streptosporangiaceae bacterium]
MLISDLRGTAQDDDLSEPVNCGGYGRIRHFSSATSRGWPPNPLPVLPAAEALGLPPGGPMRAQVFQNAVCNWRCWYCYVPLSLLSGSERRARWFTAAELVDLYLTEPGRPTILDLSGGQPDLIPEWVAWTLQALADRGADDVYVWSDDNLSGPYF